jgi:hypothetical protein
MQIDKKKVYSLVSSVLPLTAGGKFAKFDVSILERTTKRAGDKKKSGG